MASMNFWGVEVKGKEPNSVEVEEGQVIHVSQVTLGEAKKDNEHVTIHVKVGDKKLVMGMLSQKNPQLSFDLVFDEDFEISHNWKNGSIHFLGYQTDMLDDSTEKFSDSSDEDEDVPALVPIRENGKPATVAPAATKAAAKPNEDNKPKPELKVDEEDDEGDDDEDGSDDESDDDEDDVDMLGGSDESDEEEGSEDDNDDDDNEGSSDEEETPKMVQVGKKRSKTDAKTPEPKKAKLATPQKTDGKKAYPSKKTLGADKSTPKSNGHVSGGSSKKTFNSGKAFGSHSKGKHGRK